MQAIQATPSIQSKLYTKRFNYKEFSLECPCLFADHVRWKSYRFLGSALSEDDPNKILFAKDSRRKI